MQPSGKDSGVVRVFVEVGSQKKKVFSVPLSRLSLMMATLLISLVWSVTSSVMLVGRFWNPKVEKAAPVVIQAVGPESTSSQEALNEASQKIAALTAKPVAAKTVVAKEASKPVPHQSVSVPTSGMPSAVLRLEARDPVMEMADELEIHQVRYTENSNHQAIVDLSLVNNSNDFRQGFIWVQARYLSSDGREIQKLVSSFDAQISKDGEASQPHHASSFAIHNAKKRRFILNETIQDGYAMTEVQIGVYIPSTKVQKVVSITDFFKVAAN